MSLEMKAPEKKQKLAPEQKQTYARFLWKFAVLEGRRFTEQSGRSQEGSEVERSDSHGHKEHRDK